MSRMSLLTRRLRSRLAFSIQQSAGFVRSNMKMVGVVTIIGQPLYYLIWTTLAPDQFESLAFRTISALVALPMLFERQMSNTAFGRRWLTTYWFVILLYQLPFVFVFMSLMNGFSVIWSLSTMAAITLLVVLVFDWLMIVLLATIGTLLAWLLFVAVDGVYVAQGPPLNVLLPIFMFSLIAGATFNYKTELVSQEKLSAMTDVIATMAHELRTPLLGIASGARGLERYLPALIDGYKTAQAQGLNVTPIRNAHFRELNAVLGRIQSETHYSSVVLDMLLVNASRTEIDCSRFEQLSIRVCVEQAMERYPFQTEQQSDQVNVDGVEDFHFTGSQLLTVHILFNLLKNALYFIDKQEDAAIRIWTEHAGNYYFELHFRDNGPGIKPETLPRIFDRFYSDSPRGQSTGIGLAFARLVMESFDGQIMCRSVLGDFCEFVMIFPLSGTHE